MSQQIVVVMRISPDDYSERGFADVKDWCNQILECPYGDITDVHVDVEET